MNMKNNKGRNFTVICFVVTGILFLFLLPKGKMDAVQAAPEKVRVGYFHVSGYQEVSEDGIRSGFGYDYLQEIAKYTGWEYEFVDATWDECLNLLAKGEIDLMTCARNTPERARLFDFSEYRMGLLYCVMAVLPDDERYSYNDFKDFDGMKVGIMKGNRTIQEISLLCSRYDITMEKVIYDTEEEVKEALYRGEVDAVASSNQRVFKDEKIIGRWNLGPFFALVKKGDVKRKRELDDAMAQIMLADPYFEAELYDKYFGNNSGYKVAFSKEEKEYIADHRTVRIATSQNSEPVCYYNGKEYEGIIIDCVKMMAGEAGLKVEYVETASYKESMELMEAGKVDVIPDFYSDYGWGEKNGVVLTRPYLDVQYVEVTSGRKKARPEETLVAACEDFFFNDIYILEHYPKENIVYCNSESDCVDAVRKGRADVTFVNNYSSKVLLEKDRNLKLDSRTLYDTGHKLSMAIPEDNKILCHIFDKAIMNIEADSVDRIVEKYVYDNADRVSFVRYIYDNSFEFLEMLFVLVCIIAAVLVYINFQRKKYNRHIYELAYRDSLTGLGNVNKFEDTAEKRWLEYRGRMLCMISLDISHFTTINETYGRAVGDLVIGYVGGKLGEIFEERGVVARNKVDTFLILIVCASEEEVDAVISEIKTEIGTFHYEESRMMVYDINLTYNFGIVREKCTGSTRTKKLIDRAEMARKASKKASTHIQYYNDEMEQRLLREKVIEDTMESALADGEFIVYYQPKYRMTDNKIIGAEALIRWNSKEFGFMNPGEFIPVFEHNGFIVELDFYVMEQVYRMLRKRLDQGKQTVRISINQSRMHFAQKNYIERLNGLREKYQIPDDLIELELTESIFADMKDISRIVEELKSNRYYLSVDDFGSGYSSLNMIKEIPMDALKIDKDFLSGKRESGRYQKVIEKVVELARELNMDIICEGVEEKEQADFLKSVGCLYAQGFLYARPMPEESFAELLEGGKLNGQDTEISKRCGDL